jgi:hypothetical protein
MEISVEPTKYRGFYEINRYKEAGRRMPSLFMRLSSVQELSLSNNLENLPVNSVLIFLQQL